MAESLLKQTGYYVEGTEVAVSSNDQSEKRVVLKKKKRQPTSVVKKKKKIKYEIEVIDRYIIKCIPSNLCDLIQDLSDSQRSDVKSIGFGGLLRMNGWTNMHWKNVFWFIEKFNPFTRVLEFDCGKNIVVTPADIEDLFLLPRNEDNQVMCLKNSDVEGSDFLKKFKLRFGFEGSVNQNVVSTLVLSLKGGGDDFKRLFVLYALSSFLAPSSNTSIEFSFIKSLIEVDKIKSFDWCTLVIERLCKALVSLKQKDVKNVSGCVLVLPLLYCHQFMWLGMPEPYSLPLIQHWTSTKLIKRLFSECKSGSCFGNGKWLEGKFPISGKHKKCERAYGEKDEVHVAEEKVVNGEEIHYDKQIDEDDRCIVYKLPPDEKTDEEIKVIAKNDFHESFLMLKRDFNVIIHAHMERFQKVKSMSKIKRCNEENCGAEEKASKIPSPSKIPNSNDDEYNDEFFKDLDEIVKKFMEIKKKSFDDDIPQFDLLTPEEISKNPPPEAEPPELSKDYKILKVLRTDYRNELTDEVIEICRADPMRWSLDKWTIDESTPFKSKFLANNERYLGGLSRREKDIADFCFYDHRKKLEINVFVHENICARFIVFFSAIQSLNDSYFVDSNIIDTWALLLNTSAKFNSWKNSSEEHKFYFNTQHSKYLVDVSKEKDVTKCEKLAYDLRSTWHYCLKQGVQLNDLKMIDFFFVPFCYNHHFLAAVVNLRQRKIQFLDNNKDNAHQKSVQWKMVHTLKEQFSIFLQDMKHPRGTEIHSYEIENVAFKWQTRDRNIDCGIFLLNHMEHFDGHPYDFPDLLLSTGRRKLRALYCSRIILSDINSCRREVLNKIYEFSSTSKWKK